MKKFVATGAAAALAAGALAAPSLGAGSKAVSVKDNKFVASSITVSRGTTVKWTWRGHAPHNVHATKGPLKFNSGVKTKGTFSKRLTKKGTYTIVCDIHAPGMKMTIKVT